MNPDPDQIEDLTNLSSGTMKRESEIEAEVCVHARRTGWLPFKLADTGVRGAPDRLFVGPRGQHVWIEFKAPKGRVRVEQQRIINKLAARGIEVHIIRNVENGIELLNTVKTED